MKIMTYVMMVFIVIMGWNLPAGMGIYWLIGAVISVAQTVAMELVQTHSRHKP
jgi:YidC/Oxa1 family membrane protein insertase